MAKDLLFEIGTEEIPARFMPGVLAQLAELGKKMFDDARVECGEVKAIGTPRRLVLIVYGVAEMQADQTTKKKGPSVKLAFDESGKPSKAAEGFAKGAGISVSDLTTEDGYIHAVLFEKGRPTDQLLPGLLTHIMGALNFPKTMRWGSLDLRFARPIHWLLALYGTEIVPVSIAGISSGRRSRGHRVLSSGEFEVFSVADYLEKMSAHYVIVDPEARREIIRAQVEKLAVQQGGSATIDPDLLEEVLYLVEYPTALCGRFEEKYLDLPPEAIITPMREHQRYFPVFDTAGKLKPIFITVRNGGTDHIDNVRHGNERVLRARLADARFFFDEDRKDPLASKVDKLKTIVFQEGLGTMYDKVSRLKKLSVAIAGLLGGQAAEMPAVERTAELSKADLVTGMVYEFTELQGTMGREYAKLSGEPEAVAEGIFEHYLPRFAGDILPGSLPGKAVAIADKMDNIVTTFSRGLIPTGSQDPYALRRQALGIVNILIDSKASVSIRDIADKALQLSAVDAAKWPEILNALDDFFRLRLKNVLNDAGVRYDIVDALLATKTDDVYDSWLRAQAMMSSEGIAAMEKAVEAFTRAANLAKNAESDSIDTLKFEAKAEGELFAAYDEANVQMQKAITGKDYIAALYVVAGLTEPIGAFFNEVMVMVDDAGVRSNRLALLKAICGLTSEIADLSKIVPVK